MTPNNPGTLNATGPAQFQCPCMGSHHFHTHGLVLSGVGSPKPQKSQETGLRGDMRPGWVPVCCSFDLLPANLLQFFGISVTVETIHDHLPVFLEEQVTFQMWQTILDPDSSLPLKGSQDLNVCSSSIQA